MKKATLSLLCLLPLFVVAQEQEGAKPEPPKTKLESFIARDGVVILRGFTTVGTVIGINSSNISVDSKEFTDASTGAKEYGITIQTSKGMGSGISRESTSFVDYDEIESLIKGLDYISKVDKTSTKLEYFQADYSTKGDLRLSVFNGSLGLFANPKNLSTYLSVSSGSIGRVTSTLKQEDIPKFRDLIVKAKERIDSIK